MQNNNWLNKKSKELFRVIARLNNEEDVARFCRDIMTESEIEAISGRWQAAKLLSEGLPQREVSDKTGVSIATVTRVNKWLKRGMGGYEKALELEKDILESKSHSHHRADVASS
jgi:TrpR-related protein YerC/YecD